IDSTFPGSVTGDSGAGGEGPIGCGRLAWRHFSPGEGLKKTGNARFGVRPIGIIFSGVEGGKNAAKEGTGGAPDAAVEILRRAAEGLRGMAVGDRILVVTWLHRGRREVLKVHPRDDRRRPLTGVFATRSPDRPNPLGLHAVKVRRILGTRLRIGPIEAIDGT